MKQKTVLFIQVIEFNNDYNFCNFYLVKNLSTTRRKNIKINIDDIQTFTSNKQNSLFPVRVYSNNMKPLRFSSLQAINDLIKELNNLEFIVIYKSMRSSNNQKYQNYYNTVKNKFNGYKIVEGLDNIVDIEKCLTYVHPTLVHLQNFYNCKLLID